MTEVQQEPIKFSFEEGGTEYEFDKLTDENKLLYNKLATVERQKNEFVGNANFEIEKLDILRAEYARQLKNAVESDPVIEVAE
tara:strand:+ start:692 stop:940 length:249 start_codon:yes stop_codon:yes gene_type:complete